jgi:hypothetical protein
MEGFARGFKEGGCQVDVLKMYYRRAEHGGTCWCAGCSADRSLSRHDNKKDDGKDVRVMMEQLYTLLSPMVRVSALPECIEEGDIQLLSLDVN